MLSNGVIDKNFILETSGLPFALFCHLAQLNPAIKPNSHFQLYNQCLAGKGLTTCQNCKEVSCYEILKQSLQVLHVYFKVCQACLAQGKKPLICR